MLKSEANIRADGSTTCSSEEEEGEEVLERRCLTYIEDRLVGGSFQSQGRVSMVTSRLPRYI